MHERMLRDSLCVLCFWLEQEKRSEVRKRERTKVTSRRNFKVYFFQCDDTFTNSHSLIHIQKVASNPNSHIPVRHDDIIILSPYSSRCFYTVDSQA